MKKVFVIMPFGVRNTSPEQHNRESIDFDFVYRHLIKDTCIKAGFDVLRIDEISEVGSIPEQYLKAIIESDIVICDVSIPNGNVYYELGIRQAASPLKTILIAHEGTQLPFDISHQRVLFYNMVDVLVENFQRSLNSSLISHHDDNSSNPVRAYFEKNGLASNPTINKISFEQDLNGRIERAKNANQLVAVWGWARAYDPLPLFSLLRLAERLGESEQWAVASDILVYLIQRNDNDYELHRLSGYYLRKRGGDYERDAIVCLEKALSINPSDLESLGILGGIYKRQGNYQKARELYSKGIVLSPNNLYMRVTEAAMIFLEAPEQKTLSISRYKKLLEDLEQADKEISDEWTEVVKAEAYFAMGDLNKAKKHFTAALAYADGKVSTKSALEQILLLGQKGLNPAIATELKAWCDQELQDLAPLLIVPKAILTDNNLPVIIHLTDVHFGSRLKEGKEVNMHRFRDGDYTQTLSDHIKDEFSRYFKFDSNRLFLVISGDFTYTANKKEFNSALQFTNEICSFLNIPKERVIFTPGNHDIDWHSSKADIKNRFDNYISFLNNFYGPDLYKTIYSEIKWDLSVGSERPEPEQIISIQPFPDSKIVFVSFNSCMYETDQDHYGFIGGKQFRTALKYFNENGIDDSYVKIAVTHHHLLPHPVSVNTAEGKVWMDLSIVRDSGLVEYKLENMGFDIILHGHKHNAQLRETIVRDKHNSKHDKKLIVCGAGSCGVDSSELEHNQANHYQVIELLSSPRTKDLAFIKLVWRELEVHDASEWQTSINWVING